LQWRPKNEVRILSLLYDEVGRVSCPNVLSLRLRPPTSRTANFPDCIRCKWFQVDWLRFGSRHTGPIYSREKACSQNDVRWNDQGLIFMFVFSAVSCRPMKKLHLCGTVWSIILPASFCFLVCNKGLVRVWNWVWGQKDVNKKELDIIKLY
jgi:hypothetical protein